MDRYYIDLTLTFDYGRAHPKDPIYYFVCDSKCMMSSSVKDFPTLKEAEAYCKLLNEKENV